MKKYHINDSKKLSKMLSRNKNPIMSNKTIGYMYQDLNILSEHIANTSSENLECAKGCDFCCKSVKVEVTEPEAIFIYSYIESLLNDEQLNSLFEQIDEIVSITSKAQSPLEHAKLKVPCIFLNDGACSIYEARPFICREYHSVNLKSCEIFYNTNQTDSGAVQANKIKEQYYNIIKKYKKIYEQSKLSFKPNELLSMLSAIHKEKNFVDDYFKNKTKAK